MWLRTLLINASLLVLFFLNATVDGKIQSMHYKSSTLYRFNTVEIKSRMKNDASTKEDLTFQVSIPPEAFVTRFTMVVQNIHFEGKIMKQIRKMLNKKSEAHGDRPRSTSVFRIILRAPPTVVAKFSLTYQYMLQRTHGVYKQNLYIAPGQIVDDLQVNSYIYETRDITSLVVYSMRAVADHSKIEDNRISEVVMDGRSANITYKPSPDQQGEFSQRGVNGLLSIEYDIVRAKDKGDIILWNGYFIHYFAPSGLIPLNRDVVFVLDDSGSMGDGKLEQMKTAMSLILDTLNENDRFHIVQFSNIITPRQLGFVEGTLENIEAAKEYMQKTFVAGGTTNINDAIIEGLKSFNRLEYKTEARSKILLFLTDGQATAGETRFKSILENIKLHNSKNVQIFAISFGAEADFTLMQRISYLNDGVARRIYADADSAYQLKYFFSQISKILIKGIKFAYDSSYVLTDDIAWSKFLSYYQGSEIMTMGKVSDYSLKELGLTVSERKGGSRYAVDFLADAISTDERPSWMSAKEYRLSMERMWAYLTLRYWMRLKIMGGSAAYIRRLERRMQELSVKYGFLTEYAAMFMESSADSDGSVQVGSPIFEMDMYGKALPPAPVMRVFADPHFMVSVPELEVPVCFEVIAEQGDYLLLLEDPVSGVRVTAAVVRSPARTKDGRHKTYLGEVYITTNDLRVRITPHQVSLNGLPLSWKLENSLGSHHMRVMITGSGYHVEVIVNNSTKMLIQRYLYAYHNPKQINYLNFYVTNNTGLSPKTTGLLGYFAHAHVNTTTPMSNEMSRRNTLRLTTANRETGKTYPFTANLIDRLDVFDIKNTVRCWKILPHENSALFGGTETGTFFLEEL